MKLDTIYLKTGTEFSSTMAEWAGKNGVAVEEYDTKVDEHTADGLLLINENQDIQKEFFDLHSLFDKKHLPTQKIDVNGTLQVAKSNFDMWLNNYKCRNVLVLGSDELVKNENLMRFLARISK